MSSVGRAGSRSRLLDVLLVDDDPGDRALVQDFFDTQRQGACLHVVGDGLEAVEYLHQRGPYRRAPRPDLIMLDLNMPRMDGREFLNTIKPDLKLGVIPVVVFTTSQSSEDILRSYVAGANAYVTKPTDIDAFNVALSGIHDFYAYTALLPPKARNPEEQPTPAEGD